jgi:LacI family transcriptional regulator
VDYAVERVTDLAVERLIGLIQTGDALPEALVTLIEPDLVVRESSAGS